MNEFRIINDFHYQCSMILRYKITNAKTEAREIKKNTVQS